MNEFMLSEEELDRRDQARKALRMAHELQRRRCEEDFSFFVRTFWHIIEPSVPYIHGRHIEAISDHLTALLPTWRPPMGDRPGCWQPGQIRKLVVTMPFRHGKSSFITVLWPAWVWTFRPMLRWLTSSYSLALATRDTMRMRVVLMSPLYQMLWGDRFQMLSDQNRKDRFYNSVMGYRMTSSRGAGATGEGGDIVMADDPISTRESDSEIVRKATNTWWWETMTTRKNNPDLSVELVVGQRVHQKDLASECIERGYEHLNLPARYDPLLDKGVTTIGWRDWRTKPGELLWPERFSESAMQDVERTIGPYAVACQLQQNPTPRGGAYIKREWFEKHRLSPQDAATIVGTLVWVRAWDLALSASGNANASVEMAQGQDGNTYLRRGLWWHEDFVVTKARAIAVGKSEGNQVWLEAIGTTRSAALELADALRGFAMVSIQEDKTNKVSEAIPWIAAAQAGNVYFIEETEKEWSFFGWNAGGWIEHFLDRFCSWIPDPTLSQSDDEVDCVSLGFRATRGKVPFAAGAVSHRRSDQGYGDASFGDLSGRY